MTNEEKLRDIIRSIIEEELTEISTSAGAGPYLTPLAFSGKKKKNLARRRGVATQLGYMLTPRGEQELNRPADALHEARSPYYDFRDEVGSPQHKIAQKISEINKTVDIIERLVKMSSRYQSESGLAKEDLYRRTQEALHKLENRLLLLGGRIRELRGK